MATWQEATARYAALPAWAQTAVHVALVVLVGVILLAMLKRYALRAMGRIPRMDRTVAAFLGKLVSGGGWIAIAVVALSVAGVDLAALLGGLAIGGFIVGFALKDTLGNLAAGFMLLFYRPFNVGDTVTVQGMEGEVTGLGIALTTLKAGDGRIITVPNGKVLGGEIVNHTRLDRRRADVVVGIGYDDDVHVAVKAILDALQADPRVLGDPAPSVRITALADSSVALQVRPWVKTADYWDARADFHRVVKDALVAAGCSIPFPQRVVHQA